MTSQSGYMPVLAVVLAIAVLSVMDAMIKAAAADFGTAQITFLRYAFGFAIALPFAVRDLRRGLSSQSIRANSLRGVIVVFTAFSFFFALGRLPLAFAVTLAFTAPLWMVILSRLILGEPIGGRALLAIGLGFSGVLVMVFGSGGHSGNQPLDPLGVAAALVASIGYALAIVLLRRQSAHDTIPVLVVTQAFVAMIIIAPFGIATFTPIGFEALFWFFVIGALGTFGHLILSWAFKQAPASRLAPIEYTNFLWAVGLGYVFFAETPGVEVFFGAALIISAAMIVAAQPKPKRIAA